MYLKDPSPCTRLPFFVVICFCFVLGFLFFFFCVFFIRKLGTFARQASKILNEIKLNKRLTLTLQMTHCKVMSISFLAVVPTSRSGKVEYVG